MSELAKPVFFTGIEDKLATADVYGTQTSDLVSGMDFNDDFDLDSVKGMLGGNLGSPEALAENLAPAGLQLDADALKSNLIAALPDAGAALGGMSGELKDSVLSSAGGLSQIQATLNGATSMISGANLSSLTGVGSLISGLTNAPFPISLKDCGGLVDVGSNLLKQCSSLGIPGAYTQFATGLSGSGDLGLLSSITKNILPAVLGNSDLKMLSEITKGPLGKTLNSLMPGILPSLSKSFTLPKGSSNSQITQISKQVTSVFNKVDPNWNKTKPMSTRQAPVRTAGTLKNSASLTSKASPDFKRMLSVSSKSKIAPVQVKPKVISSGPAVLSPNYGSTFPTGTTSSAQANPDGSQTTRYLWPDGTVVTRVIQAGGTQATATTEYPPQFCPAAKPTANDPYYVGDTEAAAFAWDPNDTPTEQDVLDATALDPEMFGVQSFGANPTTVVSYRDNGERIYEVTTASGESYTRSVSNDGSVESQILQQYYTGEFGLPQDPFVNTAQNTVSDPITMGYALNDVADQAQDGLPTWGAMEAIEVSFPETYFGQIQSSDDW